MFRDKYIFVLTKDHFSIIQSRQETLGLPLRMEEVGLLQSLPL